jgi:transcriptional regulator with XRE-family HTH domain
MIVRRRAPQSAAGVALRHRFARNLRQFRTARGMTQNQLASAAGLGRTFISQVEQGRFSVTLETIGALSTALGICPTMLMQSAE